MGIKQIENININEKNKIMKSIFHNYVTVKNLNFNKQIKLSQKDYNKLQLFALTESIIRMMDKEESGVITSVFIEEKPVKDKYKLNCAINKFVFYLLA